MTTLGRYFITAGDSKDYFWHANWTEQCSSLVHIYITEHILQNLKIFFTVNHSQDPLFINQNSPDWHKLLYKVEYYSIYS